MNATADPPTMLVRHFRMILLWPLQLLPPEGAPPGREHWEHFEQAASGDHWREVVDEITGDAAHFKERHYGEFVTFLPHVQRFLYGKGQSATGRPGGSAPRIRVYRRKDIARARVTYRGGATTVFTVAHVDLHFFLDIDVVILVFEIFAEDIDLAQAQDALHRFGRAYPSYWDADGTGRRCLRRVEWLAADGRVLATSDYENRDEYLSFVRQHRSPCIAAHWQYVMSPLSLDPSGPADVTRYRQIEYSRMPLIGYLALDDPTALDRDDFIRLGLAAGPGPDDTLPYSERYLQDFEYRHCYDRDWSAPLGRAATRYMVSPHTLVVIGNCNAPSFLDTETGVLGQVRHQIFLIFLIAHFHKAALLALSDRLSHALSRLDPRNHESVREFKRSIRGLLEVFLRFTHRYWSHDISNQLQAQELFRMCAEHVGTDRLYAEVREEIKDMNDYLDSDTLRRQGNTVVRLTVVTTFGLIATIATGFLGMNLIAAADEPLATKVTFFALVTVFAACLMTYAVLKSRRLSDFLEALSNDRLPASAKLSALRDVWRMRRNTR